MNELTNDDFYRIAGEYDRLAVDYCLMANDGQYRGYESHKTAVSFAMQTIIKRNCDAELDGVSMSSWISDIEKASAEEISSSLFFFVPEITGRDAKGNLIFGGSAPANDGGPVPYWYAFLKPPHGTVPVVKNGVTVRKRYGVEDFEIVNRALFPHGLAGLVIYEWSTDWSSYFDAGHEWWGASCWSIYDKVAERFAVIVASATD